MATVFEIRGLEEALAQIDSLLEAGEYRVEVGWPEGTPEHVLERAHALEYRWQGAGPEYWHRPHMPAEAYKPWAILLQTELHAEESLPHIAAALYDSGFRGRALMDAIGAYYAQMLREYLEAVVAPPLQPITVRLKEEEGAPRPSKVWYEWGDTYNAITHRVVSRSEGGSEA